MHIDTELSKLTHVFFQAYFALDSCHIFNISVKHVFVHYWMLEWALCPCTIALHSMSIHVWAADGLMHPHGLPKALRWQKSKATTMGWVFFVIFGIFRIFRMGGMGWMDKDWWLTIVCCFELIILPHLHCLKDDDLKCHVLLYKLNTQTQLTWTWEEYFHVLAWTWL